ncbi:MAG: heat-inducible transcriptional repressor HrcA [Candidatus Aminicenantaceae bacterium]
MKKSALRDKDKHILYMIVESYLKVGKPISSGMVVRSSGMDISSATVRNIMANLEKNAYLRQPHTSAGRVPTDRGLRFYVNYLFEEALLGERTLDLPADNLAAGSGNIETLLNKTSQLLSEYSDNMGFVISPQVSRLAFRHLRFIKISEEKVILLLVTTSDMVLNEVLETRHYFTQVELDHASRYLNENFRGKSLEVVRDYVLKEIPEHRLRVEDTMHKLTRLLHAYFSLEQNENQIFLQGTSKLLGKAELFDMNRLKSLFRSFEQKAKLAKLLSDFISLDRVKVVIGSEMEIPDTADCCLILSHYGYDNQVLGSLGIIGPKQLPYKKIIPLVDCIAKQLSHTISYR